MANIFIITMDDMREDEMRYMPNVRRLLIQEGTEFTRCVAQVPLCSPSRSGFLTGQLATGYNGTYPNGAYQVTTKHHGVTTNIHVPSSAEYNGSWLGAVGPTHRTGVVGKFIVENQADSIRPGPITGASAGATVDFWRTLVNATPASPYGSYDAFQYAIFNGTTTTDYTEYQDWRLAKECMTFLAGAGNTQPWALWFCPTQPHWPWQDPPGITGQYRHHNFELFMETDVSDKPSWIRNLPAMDEIAVAETYVEERVRLRELLSADRAIGAMIAYIDASGQRDNTVIIFTSDNGNMCGEHNITGGSGNRTGVKNCPYYESLHVPCVVRGPGFFANPSPRKVTVPTCNLDITATVLDVANVAAGLPNQYGTSLAVIAASPGTYTNRAILCHRNSAGSPAAPAGMPSCDILIQGRFQLNRYDTTDTADQYELFDNDADPNQWANMAYSGANIPGESPAITWLAKRAAMQDIMNTQIAP